MGDSGRDEVSDEELLAVIAEQHREPVTAAEIAASVPLTQGAVQDRLDELEMADRVVRDDAGPRESAWHLRPGVEEDIQTTVRSVDDPAPPADEPGPEAEPAGESESDAEAPPDATAPPSATEPSDVAASQPDEEGRPPDSPEAPSRAVRDRAEDDITAFDPPGTVEQQELRREALRAAHAYLQKRGTADRDDFVADVFPEHPGDYAGPDEGWWEEVVEVGLTELPDVEADDDGTLRYVGDEAPSEE